MPSLIAKATVVAIVLLANPPQSLMAQDGIPSPRPEGQPACGRFPNPDFAPPFEPPIRDYMSFRWWFVQQPGATIVGSAEAGLPDNDFWPYSGTDDSIRFTPRGMRTFVQPVDDGTRVSAYYDPKTRVVGVLEQCGTASIYLAVRAKEVPTGLPAVDHVPQVTERGVALGMNHEQVEALLGKTQFYSTQHIDNFLLYLWKKTSDCKTCPPDRYAMKFDFENDRLIAMSYQVWLHPDIHWTTIVN